MDGWIVFHCVGIAIGTAQTLQAATSLDSCEVNKLQPPPLGIMFTREEEENFEQGFGEPYGLTIYWIMKMSNINVKGKGGKTSNLTFLLFFSRVFLGNFFNFKHTLFFGLKDEHWSFESVWGEGRGREQGTKVSWANLCE